MDNIQPSSSERMFALQWWRGLDWETKFQLAKRYRPHWPTNTVTAMVDRSTSWIVKIYRGENR
jgi:hypothetical protein